MFTSPATALAHGDDEHHIPDERRQHKPGSIEDVCSLNAVTAFACPNFHIDKA